MQAYQAVRWPCYGGSPLGTQPGSESETSPESERGEKNRNLRGTQLYSETGRTDMPLKRLMELVSHLSEVKDNTYAMLEDLAYSEEDQ